MKITVRQLRDIIKEEVSRVISENTTLEQSAEDYAKFKEGQKHLGLWSQLVSKIPDIDALKEEAQGDYYRFFDAVKKKAPTARPNYIDMYFNMDVNRDQVEEMHNDYEKLKGFFKEADVTSERDVQYGRKRTQVIDVRTGQPVDTLGGTGGSLGT
jgi:hypothetical protein